MRPLRPPAGRLDGGRRRGRLARGVLGCAFALALAGCDIPDIPEIPEAGEGPDTERVARVIDGDTVVLSQSGRARLIGVDTPEVHGGVECFGREASAYAKERLGKRRVRVRRGVEERDRYGRLLVYLYVDGRMFNAELVRDGYASPMTVPPNVEHADTFVRLARRAREQRVGLWGSCDRAPRR